MRLVALDTLTGEVWINPDQIVSLRDSEDSYEGTITTITTTKWDYILRGSADQIALQLNSLTGDEQVAEIGVEP